MKKDLIPLIISILFVIITFAVSLFTDTLINYKHYLGIVLLAVSVFLYFKKKNLYGYVFGLTLLLGFIDVVDFFYINTIFQVGPIWFNPIFLVLLILFLALNQQFTEKLIPTGKPSTKTTILDRENKIENRIKSFELKFQSKTNDELRAILNKDNPYIDEARLAAERLLKERQEPSSRD